MDIKHLKIFLEVCRYESITIAADKLGMTEPSVSLSIKQLEDYYGVRLFERMNRRLYITEKGRCLFTYALNIISQLDEAKNSIQNSDVLSSLKIGSNVYLGTTLLPRIISGYNKLHPNISVHASVGNTSEIEQMLMKNELDLGLVDNISSQDIFKSSLILKENMAAVCGKDYKYKINSSISMKELSKENLLIRENGSGTRDSIEQSFKAAGLSLPKPVVESISNSALIECAKQNLGILIISEKLIEKELADGELFKLYVKDGFFLRNYYLIYHKSKYISQSMKSMIDFIKHSSL